MVVVAWFPLLLLRGSVCCVAVVDAVVVLAVVEFCVIIVVVWFRVLLVSGLCFCLLVPFIAAVWLCLLRVCDMCCCPLFPSVFIAVVVCVDGLRQCAQILRQSL